uniref:Putative DNA primase n=1 Tax=viral metagenome TaxID=1070528 RepID=A0A6M3XPY1_9ZZZZ
MSAGEGRPRRIDFDRVNAAALRNADAVVRGLLPDGRRDGAEWVALNPLRNDRKPGSFKVNLLTGKWGDFATVDRGGDLVSLAAFVAALPQREAAIRLAESLGVDPYA